MKVVDWFKKKNQKQMMVKICVFFVADTSPKSNHSFVWRLHNPINSTQTFNLNFNLNFLRVQKKNIEKTISK